MATQKRPLPARTEAIAEPERTIEGIFELLYQDRAFDPDISSGAAGVRDLFTQKSTVAASGAAQTINPAISAHIITLTANCAFTIATPAYDYVRLRLRTIQGIGGGFGISFTNSITYDYGTGPVPLTAEANITDYVLETVDGGASWRLAMVADGVSS